MQGPCACQWGKRFIAILERCAPRNTNNYRIHMHRHPSTWRLATTDASRCLAVAEEAEGVAALPVLATRAALDLVVAMALANAAALATGSSETAVLAVLHGGCADPVVLGIAANGLV